MRDIATQNLRREYGPEEAKAVHARTVLSAAFGARDSELQQESEMFGRLRARSIEMQRSVDELVEMRDQARVEATRFRQA